MNENGISPVIGVILVVGIVIGLTGAIVVIVLQVPEPQPSQPQISTFELGVSDGQNGTYNPQPGRWVPDYKDGYKLGYIVAHCSCNCTGVVP